MTLYIMYGTLVTVTFDPAGGVLSRLSKDVPLHNLYGLLPTPSKELHSLAGWYTEPSGGDIVESTTVVTDSSNHTLYAHWITGQFTISFESNGGSACSEITQEYNTPFTLPKPVRTGYTFVRWCSDSRLTTEYTATRIEARDITLYAQWSANNYTVTLAVNGGDELAETVFTATFGQTYSFLPTPNKTGHRFVGWFT